MHTRNQIFYRQTTPFALLIGGCFAVASYLCFRNTGQIFNNMALDRTISFLFIIGLFMCIRRYRDSITEQGYISYGKALLTGMWISFLTALVYCIYTIIIYTLHPELLNSYLNIAREMIGQIYGDSAVHEMMEYFFTTFTTPVTIGLSELFGKFLNGLIFSLIIAAFVRKQPIKII